MFTRATAVTLALVFVATLGFGGVEPQPAEANDTGKILAGLAAGALVYSALDDIDKDSRHDRYRQRDRYDHDRRDHDRRGFYDGNRRSWKYDNDRRRRSNHQFERHERYRQQSRHRTSPRRIYNDGYDDGFGDGHRVGYDRGYDHGYDNGWGDGYETGRYGGGGCWGGWSY